MRLLLDEMIGAAAEQLPVHGHDVDAGQDPDQAHPRGIDDCVLLAHANNQHRAVVTDNVPDFYRCHQRRIETGLSHHGLLLFTNDTFPRHRHDLFASRAIAALEHTPAPRSTSVTAGGQRVGVEVKRTDRPSPTPSMRIALGDLELDRIVVAHAGTARFPLADRIEAVPAAELLVAGLGTAEQGERVGGFEGGSDR